MNHPTLLLLLGFCLLIVHGYGQSKKRPPVSPRFAAHFEGLRIAHRGGYANGPENALSTILKCVESGVKAIEIDIRLTRDGQLVVFHDPTIERLLASAAPTKVNDLSLAELQAIPLRDQSHGLQYVSSLDEVLDALARLAPKKGLPVLLEFDLKDYGNLAAPLVAKVMATIQTRVQRFGPQYFDQVFVSTFYPEVLLQLGKQDRRLNIAFAVNSHPNQKKLLGKIGVLTAPLLVRWFNVRVIEPNMHLVNARYVRRWQKRNVLINAYTANRACEKRYLAQFPIAFTTNCPGDHCQPHPSDEMGKPTSWCTECEQCNSTESSDSRPVQGIPATSPF